MAMVSVEPVRVWSDEIERGRTLPYEWYVAPEIFELERERVFRRSWQFFGLTAEVANPGDVLVGDVGGVPLLVVRGRDGELRAHVNVCRHRGHAVVTESGQYPSLQCGYHGWTYGLDGSLKAARFCQHEPDFDKSELGLLPARVDVWGPLIFVNLDADAEDLIEWIRPVEAYLLSTGIDLDRLRPYHRTDWDINANWKVMTENNGECYHCPIAHPSLKGAFDGIDLAQAYEYFGVGKVHWGVWIPDDSMNSPDAGTQISGGSAAVNMFPNLHFGTMKFKGEDWMHVINWYPLSPTRCHERIYYLLSEDASEELRAFVPFTDQVASEDIAVAESAQRGMASGVLRHGRAVPNSEPAVQHFNRLLCAALEG